MYRGRQFVLSFLILFLGLIGTKAIFPHCQVPCGIYDDEMRIKMIAEHITTIEKAMNEINTLAGEAKPNYNQIVRWVTNKEKHAEELSHILTYYFMAQRLQIPGTGKDQVNYQKKLELLHHLLVYTMKARQSTDLSVIKRLRDDLKKFEEIYFARK